jgi:LysM domain
MGEFGGAFEANGPGIIARMTERGLPSMDGAPACPFVAFGDDRDGRSTSPDHRHRCFAESPPAPRALAHQEAYCLSSAFPVCPTFQDWARREAAHARGTGDRAETAPSAVPTADMEDEPGEDVPPPPPRDPADPPVRRNPPRDWAAPPPWAAGAAAAGAAGAGGAASAAGAAGSAGAGSQAEPTGSDFLAGRSVEGAGLAGSAADRLAGGVPPPSSAGTPSAGDAAIAAGAAGAASAAAEAVPHDELAGLAQGRPGSAQTPPRTGGEGYPPPSASARRPSVSSTRASGDVIPGPAWEGSRRYEAYPTIRSRAGMPGVPRIAVLVGALAIAALALFMLPALLGIGGGGSPAGSPSPSSPVATASAEITPQPAPTAQVYVIKQKDTLSKVATRFGITLDELLAANPDIKNPDKISIGQQIIIPLPVEDGAAPSDSAAP